jgi:uncharacterized protein YecT (DUF1311 family)
MNRFVPALLLLLGSPAFGQADEENCCCDTAEVAACLAQVYKEADTMLNRAYRDATSAITTYYKQKDAQNLRDAQRLWIAYRDAACKAESGLWGRGTGGPSAHVLCLIRITRIRTDDLKRAYLSHRQVHGHPSSNPAAEPDFAGLNRCTPPQLKSNISGQPEYCAAHSPAR